MTDEIERFDPIAGQVDPVRMWPNPHGKWMLHSDHLAAMKAKDARIEELEAALSEARLQVIASLGQAHEGSEEVEFLQGLLWMAWSEFNAIRARSGAPIGQDGMQLVAEDWWNTMTEAFAAAIGEENLKPWPSKAASIVIAALQLKAGE